MLHICTQLHKKTFRKLIPSNIKNIIFDLGGVIINLDEPRAHAALARLGGISTPEMQERIQQNIALFHDFERGHISNEDFLKGLRKILNKEDLTDAQLIEAWNAMLLELPKAHIDTLKRLGEEYRLFLFSNTNDIHIPVVHKKVKEACGLSDLSTLFEKVCYSQQVGERKPDAAAWQMILDEFQLDPAETLFIDDNKLNIQGAAGLGIQTWHYPLNQPLHEAIYGATRKER